MLDIERIRELAKDYDNVLVTTHTMKRFRERGICFDDVINGINTGKIIEQYPDDYPEPSCLILGSDVSGKSIHICAGTDNETLFIITVYYPSEEYWESNYEIRKEKRS